MFTEQIHFLLMRWTDSTVDKLCFAAKFMQAAEILDFPAKRGQQNTVTVLKLDSAEMNTNTI